MKGFIFTLIFLSAYAYAQDSDESYFTAEEVSVDSALTKSPPTPDRQLAQAPELNAEELNANLEMLNPDDADEVQIQDSSTVR